MTNVTFTTNQVNAASLSELRELAKANGITVRHPETKKPRTAAQYREALIALIPVKVEKPVKPAKQSKGNHVRQPEAASAEQVKGTKADSKLGQIIALMNRPEGMSMDDIKGLIPRSSTRFVYLHDHLYKKGYGLTRKGDRYFLLMPEGMTQPKLVA